MAYDAASKSKPGLETWLRQHVRQQAGVATTTGLILVPLALACTLLAIGLLSFWIGPSRDFFSILFISLFAVFLTYPFVTVKPVPGFDLIKAARWQSGFRTNGGPTAIQFYFAEGFMALAAVFWAPLMFHMAIEEFRRASALRNIDQLLVTAAIRMLSQRNSRVTWFEFENAIPTAPLETIQRQLSLLQGVDFLSNEPPGATLTDSLRAEISAAMA